MTQVVFDPYDCAERWHEDVPGAVATPPQPIGNGGDDTMEPVRSRLDPQSAAEAMSDRDRRILEFERQWWKYAGAKEQAVRDLFDMSSTRYYQILNALIDTPEAMAVDPMLVKRLQRMRATRQRTRSARRLGIELDPRS